MTRTDIIRCIKEKLPELQQTYGVKRIGLFGSVSTGRFTGKSDVDLVIEFDKPIGFAFCDLVEDLENLLGRRVDVLTPDGVNSIRVPSVAESIRESTIYV